MSREITYEFPPTPQWATKSVQVPDPKRHVVQFVREVGRAELLPGGRECLVVTVVATGYAHAVMRSEVAETTSTTTPPFVDVRREITSGPTFDEPGGLAAHHADALAELLRQAADLVRAITTGEVA